MKQSPSSKPATPYEVRSTYFRANASGTGYSIGEILQKNESVNVLTLAVVGTSWSNVDTQAVIGAPTPADVNALDTDRVVLSEVELTVSSTSVAFAAPPAGANLAEMEVKNADISYRVDSTTATTTNGYRGYDGVHIELESSDEITGFQAIRTGASDAVVHVTFYRVFNSGNA